MHSEQQTDCGIVDLAILRDQATALRRRKPWLSGLCDLIEDEAALLESRGVTSTPRLDVATDIGLLVLERIMDDNVPEETGVLKKVN